MCRNEKAFMAASSPLSRGRASRGVRVYLYLLVSASLRLLVCDFMCLFSCLCVSPSVFVFLLHVSLGAPVMFVSTKIGADVL